LVYELSTDGQLRAPPLADRKSWRRVVFDDPGRMTLQLMDASLIRYGALIDLNQKTLALTKREDKNWKAKFDFQSERADQLILDGDMDSHRIHMKLSLYDTNKLRLLNRSFHWIKEY
jgi:hypothetical protein